MAQYHITVNDEFLHGLFTKDEGLSKLLKQVLHQILEAQVEEQLGLAVINEWKNEKDIATVRIHAS